MRSNGGGRKLWRRPSINHLFTTLTEAGLNLSVSQGEGAFVDGLSGS